MVQIYLKKSMFFKTKGGPNKFRMKWYCKSSLLNCCNLTLVILINKTLVILINVFTILHKIKSHPDLLLSLLKLGGKK